MQDDSFLEEMNLVLPKDRRGRNSVHREEKYNNVTTRQLQSPIGTPNSEREDLESVLRQQRQSTVSPSVMLKTTSRRSIETLSPILHVSDPHLKRKEDLKDKMSPGTRKQSKDTKYGSSVKIKSNKKLKNEEKLKPVENIDRSVDTSKGSSVSKSRSGPKAAGSKESSRLSDGSFKENSRPTDSSEDISTSDGTKEWRRITTDIIKNKEFSDDCESLAMLPAVKDIVSHYTKVESNKVMTAMQVESSKIMKMMQDFYINSQANIIQQFLLMSDDLCDSRPISDNSRIQYLTQENKRLLDNITLLNNRIEELQKIADTVNDLRKENKILKSKVKELTK
ncbi:uncharacterized protein LOC123273688 isoform X2 [Cotesia glomerata]|uniref:Uncharacterized protein n=2 Tax=Cotesia glomerata TaxID=32391 RepID=A0AAV7HUX7_COTGL|nr:uncharacterized protein LOC123273688 isoform X2 [Cotesia glomerata]XP_044597094.1 uncharacterized protein LOC123273688 isoform X2 [Cotesia glomerata]XP_044597095.1 uncharacterized protein LOC123273688 isoform X2 [Cotesia glomerata]KAH0537732.1 hypothetical protein KQX54_000979 [Cotesia glomerata]